MLNLPENPPVVAVDTENSGLHPDDGARVATISLAWPGGSVALPFDQGVRDKFPNPQLDLLETEDPNLGYRDWQKLMGWLRRQRLVMHGAKYDLMMKRAGTRRWKGADLLDSFHWCTMVASSVLEPRLSEGLDNAAQRAGIAGKTGQEELEQWLKAKKHPIKRYDLAPWHLVEPYATRDAEATLALYFHQLKLLGDNATLKARLRREFELLTVLARMEWRGVRYNTEESLKAAERLEARVRELEQQLPFKPTDNGAKAYFFGERGLTPDRLTEAGNPSLDAEQANKWAARGVRWAKEWAELARAKRAASMWYRGYAEKVGPDGRLRTVYRQTKVKSARMSVERVQLQAMPRPDKTIKGVPGVRTLLLPAPGKALWSLDLQQAELRVAAEYARCEKMLEMLAEGVDFHGETCRTVLGAKPSDPGWTGKRYIAKRLTFASIFQVGGETFQATLSKETGAKMPLEQCYDWVNSWRQQYPEFRVAYRRAEQMAQRRGYVRLLPNTDYETRSLFTEHDDWNTAWSRIVQGSLAEFFKLWQIEAEAAIPDALILSIHDSLLLELTYRGGHGTRQTAEVAALGTEMATRLFQREETGVTMPVEVEKW